MRYGILLALATLTAQAQTQIDLRTQAKSVDFSGASSTKPLKTGTALPSSCGTGEVFFNTLAPTGANIFACTAPNTWTAEGGIASQNCWADPTSGLLNCRDSHGNFYVVVKTSSAGTANQWVDYIDSDGNPHTSQPTAQAVGAVADPGTNGIPYRTSAGVSQAATVDRLSGPFFCQDNGSGNAYGCSLTPAIITYSTGSTYWFRANTSNSGPASINFNALGAKTIKKHVNVDLEAGDIGSGQWVLITYDGANMQMQNAPASTSAGVASVFGRSGTVSASTGDYTTAQVTESGNLYFTNARALAAVTWSGLTGKPTGFTPLSHASTHQSGGSDPASLDASQIVSGTLDGPRLPTSALQTTQSNTITAGTQDFSGADHTLPMKVGGLAARPAGCKIGETYFASDAAAGSNLYGCTAANGWSSLGGTGEGNLAVEASGALVGSRPSINLIAGVGIQDVLTDTGSQINIQTSLDSAVVQTQPAAQSGGALLCLSSGSHQNNYQCAMQPTLGAYNSGMVLHWVPDVNGAGGATTLNIDTLGTASVKMADGVTDPGATDIAGGRLYSIWYDGTAFRLIAAPGQSSGTACPNGAPAGSVCAIKLYGDGSALTGIAISGTSPVVASFNTATSTCSIVSGAGTCTASPTAGASGGPGVIITHNFDKYIEWPVCNQGVDGSGALLGSSSAPTSVTDVSPVSINATTITFSGATVAQCGISTGSMGPAGQNGPGYAATSSTSLAIAAGAQTFATQSGLAYSAGARARVSSAANGANYMEGLITSYSGTSLVLNVDATGGSGTHADWNLNLASGLSSPVTVRTYNTAAYTGIAPSTPVPLTFDTNDYDTNGIHSTTTNSSRFVAPSAGYYRFSCAVDTGTNAASQLVQFRLNGSTAVSCGGSSCSFYDGGTFEYRPWSMELHLNANDYLECLYAPSAGTVTPVAGKYHTNATLTQLH